MTRQELVERANTFGKRYGWEPLTGRMLRGWQDEDLVPKPPRVSGRGYASGRVPATFSARDYRCVLHICRLRHIGLNRYDELRIGLWLRGMELHFTQVRKSTALEVERFRKRVFKHPDAWDPRSAAPLYPKTKVALQRLVEKSDRNIVNYPSNVSLGMVAQWLFGVPDEGATKQALAEIIRQLIPQGAREDLIVLPAEVTTDVMAMIGTLSNTLAEPSNNENPLDGNWIMAVDKARFEAARRQYRDLHRAASLKSSCCPAWLPLQSTLKSVLATPDWQLPIFLIMLRSTNANIA